MAWLQCSRGIECSQESLACGQNRQCALCGVLDLELYSARKNRLALYVAQKLRIFHYIFQQTLERGKSRKV